MTKVYQGVNSTYVEFTSTLSNAAKLKVSGYLWRENGKVSCRVSFPLPVSQCHALSACLPAAVLLPRPSDAICDVCFGFCSLSRPCVLRAEH